MPLVIESKPSRSARRACSRSSWNRADMSSPSGYWARSIRPNCLLADALRLPAPGMRTPFGLEDLAALHGEDGHDGLVDLHGVAQGVVDHPAPVAYFQHRDVGLTAHRETTEPIGLADRARRI